MPETYGYGDMVQCDTCMRTTSNKTTFLMYRPVARLFWRGVLK